MKSFLLSSLWLSLATGLAAPAPRPNPSAVSYDGHKVLRVKTGLHREWVHNQLSTLKYDTWSHDEPGHVDLVVSAEEFAKLQKLGLDYHTMHEDLGKSISSERAPKSTWKRTVDDLAWFDSYHPYEEHLNWFRQLHASFPNQSEIISAGKSYEGRDLLGIHLWGGKGPGKPAVLWHASVHAREWITTPTVEYLALQLVNGYKSGDNVTQGFLDSYDFFIFPFVNPDGFVFTQTTNRLWRKNRQPSPRNSTCIGRDINRNWEYGWNANTRGASTNPCSEVYRGEAPSDAPENKAYDTHLRKLRDTQGIKLYIDWHSYGQYILSPYGANETQYAPSLGKWTHVSSLISEAIRDSSDARTTFTFGPSGATLYTTTGAAPDHVYTIGGAEWSYTIELRDTGDFGFVLPAEQILPNAKEQWIGQQILLSLLDEVFFDGKGPAIFF
ncbi:zinc carboxypeptidase [Dendryphion nanum]|uniref:Zinc carboxypeptidase n=1 Tax=Dendryphion nanum TaxID=256645 RepID=A0A9P9DNI0_9PLEO|nr:zinc carboxypeptidase [Dendryphion nanum]